jgi:hypothetical protein
MAYGIKTSIFVVCVMQVSGDFQPSVVDFGQWAGGTD